MTKTGALLSMSICQISVMFVVSLDTLIRLVESSLIEEKKLNLDRG